MAAINNPSNFIVQVGEEYYPYPYPSHVNAPSLVTVKLSGKDKYKVWKAQMLCLLASHNMVGFISGNFVNPESNVKRRAGDIEAWVKSDTLVKSWILGTISEEAAMNVVNHLTSQRPNADFTAKDVWDELQRIYDPRVIQEAAADTITNETELTSSKSNVDRNSLKILLDFLERGRKRCTQNPPTISVVPSVLKDFSPPRSFSPMTVSIGPLHKDDENTKEFERVKLCYLHDLLQRNINSRPDQILKECVEKVNGSMDEIRASYADIIPFSDIDLANMMVMDACFILEFCLKHDDEENFDNILDGTLRDSIAIDLILIENQIPFFVLEDIFNCTCRISASTPPLTKLLQFILVPYVDPFQYYITNKEFPNTDIVNESTHDHVLGYLHKCYKRVGNNMQSNRTVRSEPTTLKEVAMKIKSYLIACFSWFQGKPTNLLVPTLNIYIPTGQILRNLIAYEQCFPKVHNYFTSYAIAMRKIVEDEDDVATLVELNVLVNNLNSNKEAANMLQTLSNTCTIIDFSSYQELMQLKNYFDSSWIRNLRRLRSTYFGSPWSAIAFVAGIILFSLTIVQTVFTIRGPL